eukprot:Unigene9778_Nuclearia_a/m.29862 Unigene9778_Nuclearia_a/g.29862  ORF Unigene9778_Nuclearia_a/g.29862 Unigene9778_Nuclearia_a/m.29862 type:complete len:393 (-) Unigene9778_Nuclearia_a:1959-3137(-)
MAWYCSITDRFGRLLRSFSSSTAIVALSRSTSSAAASSAASVLIGACSSSRNGSGCRARPSNLPRQCAILRRFSSYAFVSSSSCDEISTSTLRILSSASLLASKCFFVSSTLPARSSSTCSAAVYFFLTSFADAVFSSSVCCSSASSASLWPTSSWCDTTASAALPAALAAAFWLTCACTIRLLANSRLSARLSTLNFCARMRTPPTSIIFSCSFWISAWTCSTCGRSASSSSRRGASTVFSISARRATSAAFGLWLLRTPAICCSRLLICAAAACTSIATLERASSSRAIVSFMSRSRSINVRASSWHCFISAAACSRAASRRLTSCSVKSVRLNEELMPPRATWLPPPLIVPETSITLPSSVTTRKRVAPNATRFACAMSVATSVSLSAW